MSTLYEQLGGEAGVDAAVDKFYDKVMADDRINAWFEGIDLKRQLIKQKHFLTMAFGGPSKYTGKNLRSAHARFVARGLTDEHFDAVVENLGATLREMGVAEELVGQAAAVAESTRNDVLGR